MTTDLAKVHKLPAATPQLTQSLSQDECAAHRESLTFEVEIILQGYWVQQHAPQMKAAILADWADELEDWPVEQIRWALRKWRGDNPDKRPNPSHISNLLKAERGKAYFRNNPEPQETERRSVHEMTEEELEQRRKEAAEIMARFRK